MLPPPAARYFLRLIEYSAYKPIVVLTAPAPYFQSHGFGYSIMDSAMLTILRMLFTTSVLDAP